MFHYATFRLARKRADKMAHQKDQSTKEARREAEQDATHLPVTHRALYLRTWQRYYDMKRVTGQKYLAEIAAALEQRKR